MTERTLSSSRLTTSAAARHDLFATVSNDTTFEEVVTPGYWANHVPLLMTRPWSRVSVVREDGTMYLELLCIEAQPGLAKMRVITKHVDDKNLEAIAKAKAAAEAVNDPVAKMQEGVPSGYKLNHVPSGVKKGFSISLKSTGQVLKEGIGDRGAAIKIAEDHKRESETIAA